jgi:hypothetical protein
MNAKKKSTLVLLNLAALLLAVAGGTAWAQGRKGVKAATGPFSYDPAMAGSATFLGSSGSPVPTSFMVCAPSGGTIFPAGQPSADAEIRVFGVEKVGDADGNPLVTPINLSLDMAPGSLIAGAFLLTPSAYTFVPGGCTNVDVSVSNPGVDPADYGDYVVTMKAQAIGSGIGVGSGSRFKLSLRVASLVDLTPPDVTIDEPADSSSLILGPFDIKITATDPAPGSGLGNGAVSATIKSAGNTVNAALTLTDDGPQGAGDPLTAMGSFTPTGGSGADGTSSGTAFTSGSRSGIGTYTVSATATDLAGNPSSPVTSTFQVRYDVQFTDINQTGPLSGQGSSNSTGQYKFTVKRSSTTSDGAFMYDQTVVAKLFKASDLTTVIATHPFGAGAITADVQIGATCGPSSTPCYQTNFKRGDLPGPPSASDSYVVKVYFQDVDNNQVLEATASALTF